MTNLILPVLIISLILNAVEFYQSRILIERNVNLQSQIELLNSQAATQAEAIKHANETADMESKQSIEELKKIYEANIPKNCEDAIKWAIGQSRQF